VPGICSNAGFPKIAGNLTAGNLQTNCIYGILNFSVFSNDVVFFYFCYCYSPKTDLSHAEHQFKSDIWRDPRLLFSYFKRPVGDETEKLVLAADMYTHSLDLIKNLHKKHHRVRRERVSVTGSHNSRKSIVAKIPFY